MSDEEYLTTKITPPSYLTPYPSYLASSLVPRRPRAYNRAHAMIDHPLTPDAAPDEVSFDASLRPRAFVDFVGQRKVIDNLKIAIEAAKARGEPVDHVLFSGLPGLGKTTLAGLVAAEMGTVFRATSGPALERAGDLAGILTNLGRGDILFIDEVHRLAAPVEEFLYPAMEDHAVDIVIDHGPHARSVRVDLAPFTLIGATTREGLLSAPFRSRFGVLERLEPYPWEDLLRIIRRSAKLLGVELEDAGAELLARRARGTPRIANRFLRRVRDLAQLSSGNRITAEVATRGLEMLGVDEGGLDALDRRVIEVIVEAGGGPIGLKTVAAAVGEEEDTIEEVYEPFLIREGFLIRTPRGRKVTAKAYAKLGKRPPDTLFS